MKNFTQSTSAPLVLNRLSCAVLLAMSLPVVQAQSVNVNSIAANGSYILGTDAQVNLSQTSVFGSVDVVRFPSSGVNSAVLHSYGSASGNFGSRSSGNSVYDVTGSFKIVETITNNTLVAQTANFSFYITPGYLTNSIGSALTGTDFVTAGLKFDIKRNGSSVWGSSATLASSASGATFDTTGDATLYSGAGTYYSVNGVSRSVDLGVIDAGESIQLSYQLDTFARGNSVAGVDRVVPPTSYFVPEQSIVPGACYGGYGDFFARVSNGYGGGCNGSTDPIIIPAHTVEVPGYTVNAAPSGSQASSGDPFDINFRTGVPFATGEDAALPLGIESNVVSFTAAVPEPSTYALMVAGLAGIGWAARRRRSSV